ncbi:hypothetical protein BTN49_1004 [Candidatus Enterovibrio escicola]|uniref:Uncharacterized protein n=1 Tax=Candidatus Enterovibrio escicola TaxID=1927127 RepID=A0A2A5T5H4_9GAMM|nr:hypothetical protein BTN49_1004 [Candidatus Enterovibrio escacola]
MEYKDVILTFMAIKRVAIRSGNTINFMASIAVSDKERL